MKKLIFNTQKYKLNYNIKVSKITEITLISINTKNKI